MLIAAYRYYNRIIPNTANNRIIQKAYVINLPTSVDRWAYASNELKEFDVERVDGVLVKSAPGNMKKGVYGCTLAHINVLKKIIDSPAYTDDGKEIWYLIFEDDVKRNSEFVYNRVKKVINSLPVGANAINLGAPTNEIMSLIVQLQSRSMPGEEKVYRGFYILTHAYAINHTGAKKLLAIAEDSIRKRIPIDLNYGLSLLFSNDAYLTYIFKQNTKLYSDIQFINKT